MLAVLGAWLARLVFFVVMVAIVVIVINLFLRILWPHVVLPVTVYTVEGAVEVVRDIGSYLPPTPVRGSRPTQIVPTVTPGLPGTPTPTGPNPTATASPGSTPVPGQPTRIPANTEVVIEPNGRIWMPNFQEGMTRFETSFTAPSGGNMTRIWRGINAALVDPDTGDVIVANKNGFQVTLKPGKKYTIRGGDSNGGFALEVP